MTHVPDPDAAADATLAAARDAYLARPVSAPPELLGATMSAVRADLRPARRLALPDGGAVYDAAAANAIRSTLAGDPAVVAGRCRVESDRPGSWRVTLEVAGSFASFDRRIESGLRGRISTAVRTLFGVPVTVLDLDVVDVFAAEASVGARG